MGIHRIQREGTRLKVVAADNPVNFESIHCCGFLRHVKPGFCAESANVSLEHLIVKYNDESCPESEPRTFDSRTLTNAILRSGLFDETRPANDFNSMPANNATSFLRCSGET
ncbi:hypothetical protein HN011_003222 [Eciton burchellii]|jgi:hypothetical protein|nr:hypothetical protein HN011_003222 [Eciton burchellii]